MLRDGLLAGHAVRLAGSPHAKLYERLSALGADTEPDRPESLVIDTGGPFAQGGLTEALRQTWVEVAATANEALIPASKGKIILIAPLPSAGEHAQAARAGLENLARTLSVEWARYGITTTAIAPGEQTSPDETATLVAFLLSAAGDYFSGCRFDLS